MLILQPITRKLRESFDEKGAEWISAAWMVGWAVCLALPGDTLSAPSFSAFNRFEFTTEGFWACAFGVVGGARMAALYLNGDFKRGPTLRILASAFGFVSWLQVAALLTEGTWHRTGIMQPGAIGYLILALADLYSLVRVAADARYERK